MAQQQNSDDHIQLKRRFADFLEHPFPTPDEPQWSYGAALGEQLYTIDDKGDAQLLSRRLLVAEHHLRAFDEPLLQRVLGEPALCIPAFEEALRELIRSGRDAYLPKLLAEDDVLHVGLKGDFGRNEVSPRDLCSEHLGKLVCVFGIVTKCSLVRPKVGIMVWHHGVKACCACCVLPLPLLVYVAPLQIVKSTHYCEKTKAFTVMEYRDVTALSGAPTSAAYPTKDNEGNLLTTEAVQVQGQPECDHPGAQGGASREWARHNECKQVV